MNLSARSQESASGPSSGPSTSGSFRPKERGEWWFRLTAPQEPENATFAQREAARRGRLASVTIVFISLFTLLPLPEAISNVGFLFVLLITLAINAFSLFVLNRKGHLAAAGWLIVSVLDLGFALSFLSMPHGVTLSILPAFDLMAVALMVVVAFFSPRSVFIVMTINSLFIALWIYFGPHSAEVSQLLKTDPYVLFYPSLGLEIFSAILLFVWVNSAVKAIADLDRSEEIVALERREIAQQEEQLILKQQLEAGVEQILQTHVKAANGEFSARAPLSKENVLWKVAYSLNNLLSRLERYNQVQVELNKTQNAIQSIAVKIHDAKENKQQFSLQRTGTMLDPLLLELVSYQIAANQQPVSQRLSPLGESNDVNPPMSDLNGRDAKIHKPTWLSTNNN